MRSYVLATLCAAPLALAGTLQEGLNARGILESESSLVVSGSRLDSNNNNNDNNNDRNRNNNNNDNLLIEQSQLTDIILIWVNPGNNAATTTITTTQTVTAAAAANNGGNTGGNTGGKAGSAANAGGASAAVASAVASPATEASAAPAAAAAAAGATHTVVVGGPGGLTYTPDTISAAVGDMVIFEFQSQNHTATQSAFTTPCEKLAGGMDTGFVPNLNNSISPPPQVAMQVNVSTPIWFYCRQSGHCGKGMTFSINPTVNKTQAMFQQLAIAQNGTGAASPITGGSASAAGGSTTLSTAAAGSAATAAAGSSSGTGTGLTTGTGLVEGGACQCAVLCDVAAFPLAAQGIAGFGGMSGSVPMASLEAI